jgi:two-component system response regulator MprA
VLVVDDDPDVRELLRHILETSAGVRVIEAETSEQALRIARGRRLDLVISDIARSRGTDGLTFLGKFKKLRPSVPVIICSGQRGVSIRRQAKGAFAFVPKASLSKKLLSAVRKALASRRPGKSWASHHVPT